MSELHEVLSNIGVETSEAKRLANLIESANNNELVYMLVYIAGMKAGAETERIRRRNEKRDEGKIR